MIGLLGSDPHWRGLAAQEGVELAADALGNPALRVLVVDREPGPAERRAIVGLLGRGGAVLTDAGHARSILPGLASRETRVEYLLPDAGPLFAGVGIVELHTRGWRIAGAQHGHSSARLGAVLEVESGGGRAIVLPFRVDRALADTRSAVRVIDSTAPKPVYERVSRVSRGEVRRLVANCWRRLLNRQGLPYAHLSYGPAGPAGWFGFRVDSDFGSSDKILKTVAMAREAGLKMSWFLNARAIEPDLARLLESGLRGQDVQLHCYDHRVYPDRESNRANLEKGTAVLARHGARPAGAASPYGDWNESWQRALELSGLEYSSDFGVGYDDLPFRPLVDGRPSAALQVPCHPVSPGRLRACRARPRDIIGYFAHRVELCCRRHEPALLYGHPGPVAEMAEVMGEVLRSGPRRCGGSLTWTDYARWWRERETVNARVRCDGNEIRIEGEPAGETHALVVEFPGWRAEVEVRPGTRPLAGLPWKDCEPARIDPARARIARRGLWQARMRQWLRDRRRQT